MTKEFLIKIFTIFSIVLIAFVAIGGLVIFFTASSATTKGIGVGLTVGMIIGRIIKIKYTIPKMFKDKDERTIVITLLTKLISQSVFAILTFFCLILTVTGIIVFKKGIDINFLIFIAVISILTIIVDKNIYKVLCEKL